MVRSAPMTTDELRQAIEHIGGLHSQAGLARRWHVSKAYVSEVCVRLDFPRPVTHVDGRPLWAGTEADVWHDTPRKPGPAPRAA